MKKLLRTLLVCVLIIIMLPNLSFAEAIDAMTFVDEVIIPVAAITEEIRFTQLELNALLTAAAERGFQIPGSLQPLFTKPETAFKEELMRALLKEQLGFYPDTWSISDQAWYENLLVRAALRSLPRAVLPQQGDISQKDALKLAIGTVQARWTEPGDLLNPALWQVHTTFSPGESEAGGAYRQWVFWFEPLTVENAMYQITLRHDGYLLEARTEPGTEALDITPGQVQDRYTLTHGAMNSWAYETWVRFQRDLGRALENTPSGEVRGNIRLFLEQEYARPTADMLSKALAISIASALPEAPQELNLQHTGAVLLMDAGIPVWKVELIPMVDSSASRAMPFLVEVNALDGTVRNFRQTDTDSYQYRLNYVLERLAKQE